MSNPIDVRIAFEPPCDLEAEQELVSCMLQNNQIIDEVRTQVSADDFHDLCNQVIVQSMYAMAEKCNGHGIDFVTLRNELATKEQLVAAGGDRYLSELVRVSRHTANAIYYAKIIRQKSVQRQLQLVAQEILREASNPADPEGLLDHCEQRILAIRDKHAVTTTKPVREGLHSLLDRADMLYQGGIVRRRTGLIELDGIVKLSPGQLIILAARTSVGKTLFGIQLAKQISEHSSSSEAVFIASLEMQCEEIASRLVSAFGNVPTDVACVERLLNKPEAEQLNRAVTQLENEMIFINDSGTQTVAFIAAEARRIKRKYGLGLVVVDYLQLIKCESSRTKTRAEALGEVSSGLKRLAKELQCPIIALCQLNRETGDNEEPELRHIRESGSIEQDADMVWMLWRKAGESSDPNQDQIVFLKVAKNRQGPTGIIQLIHRKEYMRFDELHQAAA